MTNSISDEYLLIGIICLAVLYFMLQFIWNKTNKASISKYNIKPLTLKKSLIFLAIIVSPTILLISSIETAFDQPLKASDQQILVISLTVSVLAYIMILARKTSLITALIVPILLTFAWPLLVLHFIWEGIKLILSFYIGIIRIFGGTAGNTTNRGSDNWEKINQFHTHKNDYDAGRRRDPPPPNL